MTAEELYGRFIIKINKNAQTDNAQCDRGKFVEIYNEEKNKWLEWTLEKRNEDDIRYAQPLKITDHSIKASKKSDNTQRFGLPGNYFDLVSVYAIASTDCCEGQRIDLYELKAENKNEILQDENNKPSFDYRESWYELSSNAIIVYTDDFKIDNIKLSYYRYPIEMELEAPEDPESEFKNDIKFLLDNKVLDRILTMCSASFELNNNNQKYQADLQRTVQKF